MDHLIDYRNTSLFPLQATNAQKRVTKEILKSIFHDQQLIDQALEYITGKREPSDEDFMALLAWMDPTDVWEGGEDRVSINTQALNILMAAPALLMEQRGQLTLF